TTLPQVLLIVSLYVPILAGLLALTFNVEPPEPTTDEELKLEVVCGGNPLRLRFIVPEKPILSTDCDGILVRGYRFNKLHARRIASAVRGEECRGFSLRSRCFT